LLSYADLFGYPPSGLEPRRSGCYRLGCGAGRSRHSLRAKGRAPAPSGSMKPPKDGVTGSYADFPG